jgi:uncharacterized protein YdeI (YjbR/CyaY-like superfamily)
MAASDPVTAVANSLSDALALTQQIQTERNTAAEVAAAQAKQIQDMKDAIAAVLEKMDEQQKAGQPVNLDEIRILCA